MFRSHFAHGSFLLAFLLAPLAAWAQNEVCIPMGGTPTIDGQVVGDAGWNGAARIDLDCTGVAPTTYARWCRTATHVYFGLAANTSAVAPNSNDRIVLTLSTGQDQHAWRIHIEPFAVSPVEGPGQPVSVRYWRNLNTWLSSSSGTDPMDADPVNNWLRPTAMGLHYYGASSWGFEMSIPIVADPAPDSGVVFPPEGTSFRLYINLLKTSGSGFACQYPWRKTSTISGTLTGGTPSKSLWGTAWFDNRPGCNVYLVWSKIGLITPPCPSAQELLKYNPEGGFGDCSGLPVNHLWPTTGPVNTFFAKPRNRMATVANLQTKFWIADWGVPAPGDWATVQYPADPEAILPALPNPTPSQALAPGIEGYLALDWPLTYKQSCELAVAQKSIQAEMLTGDADTHFSANPVQRTMDTVPASVFSREARLGTKGLPAHPDGRQHMVMTIQKETFERRPFAPRRAVGRQAALVAAAPNTPRAIPDSVLYEEVQDVAERSFRPGTDEFITWVCRCFRKTGQQIRIDDGVSQGTFDTTEQVGAFGYIAGHQGDVESWKSRFTGQGLRQVRDGLFEMDIDQDKVGLVETFLEAQEFREFGVDFRIGFAIPHGDFADVVDGGWSESIDFEYRLTPMFSLEAVIGFEQFDEEDVGFVDVSVVHHSLNGKAYFLEGDFRPFVHAGFGFYATNPGDDDWGVNAGAGLRYRVSDLVGVELAYTFHTVFADHEDPRFSTIQLGVGVRF